MDQLSHRTLLAWKVAATILQATAILCTAVRLSVRLRMSKLGWDDYLVVIPFFTDVYFSTCLWAVQPKRMIISGNKTLVTNYLLTSFPCITTIWSSRAVLVIGLARIFSARSTPRYIYTALAGFFALAYLTVIAVTATHCVNANRGSGKHFPLCIRMRDRPIMLRLLCAADLTSDTLLALIPLYMFRHLKLPIRERRMILFTFASGSLSCVIPITFITLSYRSRIQTGILATMLGQLEAALTLMVCNLLIIVSTGLRVFRRNSTPPKTAHQSTPTASRMIHIKAQPSLSVQAAQTFPGANSTTTDSQQGDSATHITLTELSESYYIQSA